MTVIIFVGVQASGKSTFYKQHFEGEFVHVNLDSLRTRNKERLLIEECFQNKKGFVVDNTNPTKMDRERYIGSAKEHGYRVIGYYFKSDVKSCLSRNSKREGKKQVPNVAVLSTYNKLELPSYTEGFDELYYVQILDSEFHVENWRDEV